MRTDSSAKFEKRIDPNLTLTAINRAAELIEQIGAGRVVKGVADCYPNKREKWDVIYDTQRINAALGLQLSDNDIESFLARIGVPAKNGSAEIPTFRPDLVSESDLCEEVARLYGYDNINATLAGSSQIGKKSERQLLTARIKEAMSALGYHEALSFSFESPSVPDRLRLAEDSDLRRGVAIKNPLGEEFSLMRTTTVSSMLGSLALNYNRRNEEAALYEISRVYLPESVPLKKLPQELNILTMGAYASKDFYDIKGDAEYIFDKLCINRLNVDFSAVCPQNTPHDFSLPFLHPGRKAYIAIDGDAVGFIGEIHPMVAENYGIGAKAYICALYLDILLPKAQIPVYMPLPRFPSVNRDIAVIADIKHNTADLIKTIREAGGELLEDTNLFDVYQGAGIETCKRSLAFSMRFRHPERTLKDTEVSLIVNNIIDTLADRFGTILRS
jgi:phenylalanyl-tRNA synthetase beta chain